VSDHPRNLNLAGAANFRDLGGYPGSDGRRVRWRRLFRSNHLGSLTDADIDVLRGLGLKCAFDLRGAEERLPTMCRFDGIAVHSLPIEPVTLAVLRTRLATGKPLPPAETAEIMRESYRNYVRHHTHSFRALFAHLIEDRAPLVIHCTAGKDRTGFACALVLRALGVAHDVVIEDYLLTNQFWKMSETGGSAELPDEVRAVITKVDESFLTAALDTIQSDHGGLDAYLTEKLGLGARERATLAERYLEA
jgi:protein-tyrosine phosphatase